MSMEPITKRLAIALAISLSLNLFCLGFGVAKRMHGGHMGPPMMFGPHGFMQRAGLRDDDRKLRDILEKNRNRLHAQHSALMDARQDVRRAISADPLDDKQLDAALAQLRARSGEIQDQMHAALSQMAHALDAEQRKRLASAPWLLGPGEGPPPPLGPDGEPLPPPP